MQLATSIEISKPKEAVWRAITDIESCESMIYSILAIEVLEKPANGFVGFKWKETRKMFGKEETETMWITEAVENQYYCAQAQSHGCVYLSRLSLSESAGKTLLTMSFSAQAQTFGAKLMSALMGFMIKNAMKKELQKDLADIKRFVESR